MVTKGPVQVNTGANASAEGGEEEGVEDKEEKVNNLKDADIGFSYEGPQSYSEGEFMTMYKGWCKAVKEKIEEKGGKPKAFMEAAKAFLPFVKDNYANMEVYHTKSFSASSFVLGWWDDDANAANAVRSFFFSLSLSFTRGALVGVNLAGN